MKILGAGLAGLLAGCVFQNSEIIEAGPEGNQQHRAVLRFRSSVVGDIVGIDFKKVRVHKGIWFEGKFVEPNIQLANFYSVKLLDKLADRSIWNIDSVDRFIAPADFIGQLAERCKNRIQWNTHVGAGFIRETSVDETIISTIPMNVMVGIVKSLDTTSVPAGAPNFEFESIVVKRWKIPGADVYQTIYFPDPSTNLYRVSITGDLLIAEYVVSEDTYDFWTAFGLGRSCNAVPVDKVNQRYGKIAKIDDQWRKRFMFNLTSNYDIYSLGRFGTWKNILLDDVAKDISVIKKLMNTSVYERSKHNAKV